MRGDVPLRPIDPGWTKSLIGGLLVLGGGMVIAIGSYGQALIHPAFQGRWVYVLWLVAFLAMIIIRIDGILAATVQRLEAMSREDATVLNDNLADLRARFAQFEEQLRGLRTKAENLDQVRALVENMRDSEEEVARGIRRLGDLEHQLSSVRTQLSQLESRIRDVVSLPVEVPEYVNTELANLKAGLGRIQERFDSLLEKLLEKEILERPERSPEFEVPLQ